MGSFIFLSMKTRSQTNSLPTTATSYGDEKWVPGANNAHTVGRKTDHYQTSYDGKAPAPSDEIPAQTLQLVDPDYVEEVESTEESGSDSEWEDAEQGPPPSKRPRIEKGLEEEDDEDSTEDEDEDFTDDDGDYTDGEETNDTSPDEETRYTFDLQCTPEGGGPFTKQEFIDYYGGTEEWEWADPDWTEEADDLDDEDSDYVDDSAHAGEETHYTPEGEGPYTKQEFIDYYGGTTEWDQMVTVDNDYDSIDRDSSDDNGDDNDSDDDEYADMPPLVSCKVDDDDEASTSTDSFEIVQMDVDSVASPPALSVPLTVQGITAHMDQLLDQQTVSVTALKDDLRALKCLLGQ